MIELVLSPDARPEIVIGDPAAEPTDTEDIEVLLQ
jgi:hypothetical protein